MPLWTVLHTHVILVPMNLLVQHGFIHIEELSTCWEKILDGHGSWFMKSQESRYNHVSFIIWFQPILRISHGEKCPKFARFWRDFFQIAKFFEQVAVEIQEYRRILFFLLLSYRVCNQVWLNYFVNDSHFGYFTKSLKETLGATCQWCGRQSKSYAWRARLLANLVCCDI